LGPTLTTTALYRSGLEWFEIQLLKADPEGPALIFFAASRLDLQLATSFPSVSAAQYGQKIETTARTGGYLHPA
jgi:hypothetical protein